MYSLGPCLTGFSPWRADSVQMEHICAGPELVLLKLLYSKPQSVLYCTVLYCTSAAADYNVEGMHRYAYQW